MNVIDNHFPVELTVRPGKNVISAETAIATGDSFNRIILEYELSAPAEIAFVFGDGSSDSFFLEASDTVRRVRFLTEGFLEYETKKDISQIELRTLKHRDPASAVTIRIDGIGFESVEHPASGGHTVFLENSRFKAGALLAWGGGLSYFEDKKCPFLEYGNLLNNADTGRLVQQSYYGKGDEDYKNGFYNHSVWCYNPVQGGNLVNQRSRLLDFDVSGKEIYVKCRPRDWARPDIYSLSHMENRYVLNEDGISVWNRFIDFSGYPLGKAHQELPAFYTVSALGNYVYYSGSAPWTGGELTYQRDLPFWGDQIYHPECHTAVSASDSEFWGAWADDSDYGIGLFVPDTQLFKKGRFMYNGSPDPADAATNYIAPLCSLALRSGEALEYNYYISAGFVNDIRAVFSAKKDVISNFASFDKFACL